MASKAKVKKTTRKRALITGVTGQDGSFLSELLLEKGYDVYGLRRRSSSFNTWRVDHLYQDYHERGRRFILEYGDLTDTANLHAQVQRIKPDEVYNLAAQSHVEISFETPEYTANADAIGTLRLLEAIRSAGLEKKTKFYQASTSELFGASQPPQNEETSFYPRSPYGAAKLYAHWITKNYREAYGMFAVNGILFNHESHRRGETFVTRKITRAAARISLGQQKKLYLGNLDAKRDWGHARDFVRAMYLMLQQEKPEDYVIATGEQHSVRDFCSMVFEKVGLSVAWRGKGLKEQGIHKKTGNVLIEVDPRYFRPAEVHSLLGDAKKARRILGWEPEFSFEQLVDEMVAHDMEEAQRETHLANGGFVVPKNYE